MCKKSKYQIGDESYIVFLESGKEECKNENEKGRVKRKTGKKHQFFVKKLPHFQKNKKNGCFFSHFPLKSRRV